MSIIAIRTVLTVATFAAFIALWVWAWSKHRKEEFDQAARLPLESGEHPISHGDRQ